MIELLKRWKRSRRKYFNKDMFSFELAKRRLSRLQRFQPGKISFNGWSIEYADAPALASIIDSLLIKRINDFSTTSRCPRILDCGANIGISVLNYKKLYPDSHIIAFEPDPKIIPLLKKNLTDNNASDVEIVEAAVWNQIGSSQFFCEGADGSKLITDNSSCRDTSTVRTIDLNEFIDQHIDLIKMDIEGAEFEVIPHIRHHLPFVSNLLIECHFNVNEIGKFSNLLKILSDAGFLVSIAVLGGWYDLIRRPKRNINGFDEYLLVSAWRSEKENNSVGWNELPCDKFR